MIYFHRLNWTVFFNRAISAKSVLFLLGGFILKEAAGSYGNFSNDNSVVKITKDSLAEIAVNNKSSFILFYSERYEIYFIQKYSAMIQILHYFLVILFTYNAFQRCDGCKDMQLDWNKLPKKLKDANLVDVIVGEANCCTETDLCASADKKTKCIYGPGIF